MDRFRGMRSAFKDSGAWYVFKEEECDCVKDNVASGNHLSVSEKVKNSAAGQGSSFQHAEGARTSPCIHPHASLLVS